MPPARSSLVRACARGCLIVSWNSAASVRTSDNGGSVTSLIRLLPAIRPAAGNFAILEARSLDERTKVALRDGAVHPAIALGQVRIVVTRREDHFHGAPPTQQARQMLDGTRPGDGADACLD